MVDNQLTPIADYLRNDKTLNEKNLIIIRNRYQQLLLESNDHSDSDEPDESVITKVAYQLCLCIDTEESRKYLRECVKYQDVSDANLVVSGMLAGEVQPLDESLFSIPSSSLSPVSSPTSSRVINDPVRLADIKCLFNINMQTTDVEVFVRSFLLKNMEESSNTSSTSDKSNSLNICLNEDFVLSRDCPLDLFIRHKMNTRGIITSVGHQNSARLRLIEPISLVDDFSTWQYDRWCGIFDFDLVPFGNDTQFPTRWCLADNARILWHLSVRGSETESSNSSLTGRPRTASLDVFVNDICIRENNGQGDVWLKALHDEDILTFEQLTNLCQPEWDNIRKLTMHAKKILKAAVNRDNVSSERRQLTVTTVDNSNAETTHTIKENIPYSRSEMLANLHSIKLFIWHTLQDEPAVQRRGALPKLDSECLNRAFAEMREEGFADDGLFPKIAEFFLPLTISEHELRLDRRIGSAIHLALAKQQILLRTNVNRYHSEYNEQMVIFSTYDKQIDSLNEHFEALQSYYKQQQDAITSIRNTHEESSDSQFPRNVDQSENATEQLNDEKQVSPQEKSVPFYSLWLQFLYTFLSPFIIIINQWFSKKRSVPDFSDSVRGLQSSSGSQQQANARALQTLHQQWEKVQLKTEKKSNGIKQAKEETSKILVELEKQIGECDARLKNIEMELNKPHMNVDKRLVKPARGLIMYGPPGTGKSEIMSKLAAKLGIVMVGPPLAAGELNRPLVGESERILIALCTRCHRLPYAMCCLSIDEIDSLAPKRSEDSSEGKVDKISVLLSLIDGIKDVPNLMILCATNRLHMMDEAFLRRMSGKFFVGRPSSDARTKILSTIPDWAMEPEMLDRLSIATTNFSGAAVRALTQAITVKCMATQRVQANHAIDYLEALHIADRIARQYQIFIGSETLPRLLLRNKPESSRHQLSQNVHYTGRIVIDLHDGFVRIEVFAPHTIGGKNELSIIERSLNVNETNIQTLLDRLTVYGKNRNVQLLQLVDLNLLASQGAYDEKKVFETLKDRYDECVAYTRSMIVYDLDALVGVNKSESNSNMGLSTSSSVVNQNIYTYVRARFRDCAIEEAKQEQDTDNIERWAIAVIREPFLLNQFCADVQFPRTRREEEERELERRKAEDLLKCVKCKDFYIENDNKMGNCAHHDGFVYDNMSSDLRIYTQSEVAMLLNQLDCDICLDSEQRDKFERQRNKFRWICCDAVFTSGNIGGCKKGKHGLPVVSGHQLTRQQSISGRADRLEQATIQHWENKCRENVEYNEKWLLYCKTRADRDKSK